MSRIVVVCTETHNDNTSIIQFFFSLYLFLRSTKHFSLKPSSSIKQQQRKERLCSLTQKFWCISGSGEVELHWAPFVEIRCVQSFPRDSSMDGPSQFQGVV